MLFYGTFALPLVFSMLVCRRLTLSSLVKAMYNYRATIDEEFDFQEGDIIAVTATPEDGWWSGELLDEHGHVWVGLDIAPSMLGTLYFILFSLVLPFSQKLH